MMRFALVLLVFAKDFTRRATRAGKLMLWRTVLSVVDMKSRYTILHQSAPNMLPVPVIQLIQRPK